MCVCQSFHSGFSNELLPVFRLALLYLLAGCGETYRPVVTPVAVTGPAPQPQSYAVVTTSAGANAPGLANVFDASGDTLLTQASLGINPLALTLSSSAGSATTANTDGTVNSFTPSTTLQTKNIQSSTLLQPAQPVEPALDRDQSLHHRTQCSGGGGADQQFERCLPAHAAAPGPCQSDQPGRQLQRCPRLLDHPGQRNRTRSLSELARLLRRSPLRARCSRSKSRRVTISRTLPVGICPVYGIGSTDNNRVFILNRGSGTVTVINSQYNELDTTANRQNLDPATGTLLLPPPSGTPAASFNAGPVFADYYAPASQLVTANYDSNTITIINVSLDQFGNDSTLFGQAVTVPVGNGPATLTILRDGSRVYVANQKDSTVSVVSLTNYQVLATIPVTGHPISIASTFSTPFGQVYVLSSDQPYMSVIRTDTNQVAASIQLDGTGVDVHTSAQSVAANSSTTGTVANAINVSHASGSGAPCGFGARCYAATPLAAAVRHSK